jgi:cytochrome c oxidase cbb3-type subunit III
MITTAISKLTALPGSLNGKSHKMLATGVLSALLLLNGSGAQAQGSAELKPIITEETLMLYAMLGMVFLTCVAVLVASMYILYLLKFFLEKEMEAKQVAVAKESFWSKFNKRFISGDLLPVEREQERYMPDHVYDGIVEMDNKMPPWLRTLFLATIAFAAIYLVNFAFLGGVPMQEDEYIAELAEAEERIAAHKLLAAASIDESNVTMVHDAAAIESGKTIYLQNCRACHGAEGEGGVGPNLADEYWMYGGSINDVFKSVKYGIPQKGMIAWQQKLKPEEIQQVSSFILSLQGSNPANAKEPQGDKYEPAGDNTKEVISLK